MKAKKYIPEGRHTVTPFLSVRGADKALDFYVQALGAKELTRSLGPDGKIMHSQLQIGDSIISVSEENPQCGNVRAPQSLGGVATTLYLYVPDVDASFKRAVEAGCVSKLAPTDMFWGDRFSSVEDPFGHQWGIATHLEDLTPEEISKRAASFFAQMAGAKA